MGLEGFLVLFLVLRSSGDVLFFAFLNGVLGIYVFFSKLFGSKSKYFNFYNCCLKKDMF